MARINLLPWREALAKEKKRQFAVVAAGSAMLSVLILVYVHIHMSGLISEQGARNKFLDGKIEEVDKQINEIQSLEADKQNLLARMKIIQTLQSSRPEIVHLFQEVAQTMPEGVYLTQLNVAGSLIKIEGVAESNANVSALMRNIDSTTRMKQPVLDVIDSSKSDYPGMSWFSMRVSPNRPSTEGDADAQGDAKAKTEDKATKEANK
jgi:type IV pilus assembly protein PilN